VIIIAGVGPLAASSFLLKTAPVVAQTQHSAAGLILMAS
jgi:hypothetical protein